MSVAAGGRAPRVLYCTDSHLSRTSGASVVAALAVAGLRARGWDVGVVAPRPSGRHVVPRSPFAVDETTADFLVEVPSVGLSRDPDVRLAAPAYGRIAGVVRDFRPDVVHCATELTIGWLGRAAARRAGRPLVTSYYPHGGRAVTAHGPRWLRPAASQLVARFHGAAALTYAPSAAARTELLALGLRDVEVWGQAVDATVFTPKRRQIVLRVALGVEHRFVFLHVGRLAAEKGVHQILDAFRIVRDLLPARSVHLIVAGAGPGEAALRRAAPADVTFLGVLDRASVLPELYASADAFLAAALPDRLGLTMLEAMASGLPVVGAATGGAADRFHDEENGLEVSPGAVEMAHAMVRLVMHPHLRAQLAGGARRTAEACPPDAELDRLERSYREVCAAHALRVAASARGVPRVTMARLH